MSDGLPAFQLKVLDFSRVLAALVGRMLSDLGADVAGSYQREMSSLLG